MCCCMNPDEVYQSQWPLMLGFPPRRDIGIISEDYEAMVRFEKDLGVMDVLNYFSNENVGTLLREPELSDINGQLFNGVKSWCVIWLCFTVPAMEVECIS